ncbi:MAG: hypothetical protein HC923_09030 [Myxococcales bacterium]|nr:hypothetical protein [Myxococcales bacterium]
MVDAGGSWTSRPADDEEGLALARALNVPPLVGQLLVRRGVVEPDQAQRFLSPRLEHLPNPLSMAGLERASNRLAEAILRREPVALYGDYDVDGVTSSALLTDFLRHHGLEPRVYIPHRLREGYGLHRDGLETLAREGARLLVTLDCGITAVEEVRFANELGLDVIVVDHHRCPVDLPPAFRDAQSAATFV